MTPHTSQTVTREHHGAPARTGTGDVPPLTPQDLVPHLRRLARELRARAPERAAPVPER